MATGKFAMLAALFCTVLLSALSASQPVPAVASDLLGTNRDINLRLATTEPILSGGSIALINVSEAAQSADLNGDGDLDDTVVHLFNAISGAVRNLRLVSNTAFQPLLQGRIVAFWAREQASDLNGDGDTSDLVLHVYDAQRDTLTNLKLAGGIISFENGRLFSDGRLVAFGVEEQSQGEQDLNRDGDASDVVLQVFDMLTGRVQNTGLAVFSVNTFAVALTGRTIAVGVSEAEATMAGWNESAQGRADLNGDGDLTDVVIHLFDTVTGRTTNVRLATPIFPFVAGFRVGSNEGLLPIGEVLQGADLNGDGDLEDTILQEIDLASGRVRNTRIAITSSNDQQLLDVALREGVAVFKIAEADQGRDLNGDGDIQDAVSHVLSTRSGRLTNLGLSVTPLFSNTLPGRAVLGMAEFQNGKDLNGDGDLNDVVMGLADFSGNEPRIVNTRLVISLASNGDDVINLPIPFDPFPLQIRDNLVTFVVSEAEQGNRDLNADGDTNDFLLHVADLNTMKTLNSRLIGSYAYRSVQAPLLRPSDGRVILPVREDRQATDLNRDGDQNDMVLQILDLRSGATRNTGFTAATVPMIGFQDLSFFEFQFEVPLLIRGDGFVSAGVREAGIDLNADGDTNDLVLHMVDIATGTVTNLARAVGAYPQPLEFPYAFTALPPMPLFFSGFFDGLFFALPSVPTRFPRRRPAAADDLGVGDAYAFIVSEAAQGNVDLNGDGDTNDTVVHATRLTDRNRNGRFDFAE
jgi:hypothetical protein